MVDAKIISNLKKSCLAFGLTKKGIADPLVLVGTGFVISEDGFFVSAAHVSKKIFEMADIFKAKGIEVDVRVFLNEIKGEKAQFVAIKVGLGYESPSITFTKDDETIEVDSDLYVGRILGNDTFPFLKFDEVTKIKILDSVLMCGYPMISESIELHSKDSNRWSPIIQPGIISSLLPVDESEKPYGIQTDIIGTGGSSGSPIINAETGVVLGIAQKVLRAEVNDLPNKAKIGLTYGVSNFFIADAIKDIIAKIKTEIDEEGNPKKGLVSGEPIKVTREDYHFSQVYKK